MPVDVGTEAGGLLSFTGTVAPALTLALSGSVGYGPRGDRLAFTLTVERPPNPLPLTVFPTSINAPKVFEPTEVPGKPGCIAPESTYGPIIVEFGGKIDADTPEEFRETVDAVLLWFEGQIQMEIFPDRFMDGYVQQHTLDPRWYGVNDMLAEFSFTAIVPSGSFYGLDGTIYRSL